MLKRCLFGYMGHRCPKLQAASAQAPTRLLPASALSWCGGGRLTKTEKREEAGGGGRRGAHSDGQLRQEDLAFQTPVGEVSPAGCG